VRNLLVFTGSRRLVRRPVNLNAILQRVLASRQATFRAQDIEIVRHYDDKLPRLKGDPLLLHQVFLNMVMNAEQALATAGRPGRIEVTTAARHGDEQVKIWRRSFDIPPPPLAPGGEFDLAADRRYAGIAIPETESLKDTIARVLPYWEGRIAPQLREGKRVLISAHGNSLRALVKHLSKIPDDEITGLEIPTGQPMVYELDDSLDATDRYYLAERT